MASQEIITLSTLGIVSGAFTILFKSNRDSIRNYKESIRSLNEYVESQDERIKLMLASASEEYERYQEEIRVQRHEIRSLRQKLEIETARTRILTRYVVESGLEIRVEDREALGL